MFLLNRGELQMLILVENIDKILIAMMLIFSSFVVRLLFDTFGQKWVASISQTSTIFALPIITYIITQTISGNIALSLGMVGALSIVRFRHPVRSPLELTVYFGMITLGITAAANVKWSLFLLASLTGVAIFLWLTNNAYKLILGKNFFHFSFTEATEKSSLHIEATEKIDIIENSEFLISQSYANYMIHYALSAEDHFKLQEIFNKVRDSKLIESYNFVRN